MPRKATCRPGRAVGDHALGLDHAPTHGVRAGRRADVERVLAGHQARELATGDRAQDLGTVADRARHAQEDEGGEQARCVGHVAGVEDPPGRDRRVELQLVGDVPPGGVEEQVVERCRIVGDPAEVADAGVGQDEPRARVAPREVDHRLAEVRDPAPSVEEHRRAAFVSKRHDLLDDRVRQAEGVRARVELEAARPRLQAAARLGDRVRGVRSDAREGHEAPLGRGRGGQDRVVGGRVAVRLVHREEHRPTMAGGVEAADDLLGSGLAPVGIVLPDVGVGVEPIVLHQRARARRGRRAADAGRTGWR